jgi:hypothetical protein
LLFIGFAAFVLLIAHSSKRLVQGSRDLAQSTASDIKTLHGMIGGDPNRKREQDKLNKDFQTWLQKLQGTLPLSVPPHSTLRLSMTRAAF